jgi:hypothetical protein
MSIYVYILYETRNYENQVDTTEMQFEFEKLYRVFLLLAVLTNFRYFIAISLILCMYMYIS